MTKCAFLINPHSHTVASRGSLLKTVKTKNSKNYELENFSDLPNYISQIAASKASLIFIEGGDGSIHGVLTECLKQQNSFEKMPAFVLLPGGMTNLIAMQIGIKKPSLKKIEKVIAEPQNTKHTELPLLNILYEDGRNYQGFLFSTGAIASGTSYTVNEVHAEGITGSAAVRTTLRRVLFGGQKLRAQILQPSPLSISVAGETLEGDHILSIATTLNKPIIGFTLFWGQGDGPLRLSYVKSGAKRLVRNLARFISKTQSPAASEKLAKDGLRSWSAQSAEFWHEGPLVLDGEFLPQTQDKIMLSTTQSLKFVRL